jgi:hypothetical protein
MEFTWIVEWKKRYVNKDHRAKAVSCKVKGEGKRREEREVTSEDPVPRPTCD